MELVECYTKAVEALDKSFLERTDKWYVLGMRVLTRHWIVKREDRANE
jgi:hypothetical protein